jgi:hypothetical protein
MANPQAPHGERESGDSVKFRKKPLVVEAVQWKKDPKIFIGVDKHGVEYTVTECCIQTLEGPLRVSPGDWIITGIKGEKYPCKPDIFAATYEPVDEAQP